MAVAEDLELDVTRLLEVLLQVDLGVPEGRLGFGARGVEGAGKLPLVPRDPHPAPAAPRRGLQDDGVSRLLREGESLVQGLDGTRRAGNGRHAGRGHGPPRQRLVPHPADGVRRRADEGDMTVLENLGEVGVLRQEPVAGMDRVGLGDLRGRDDGRDVQVGSGRRIGTDADVLVGEPHVKGFPVGLAVDGDRPDAELPAGRDDTQGDLPAVGDQDLLEHRRGLGGEPDGEELLPVLDGLAIHGKTSTISPSTSDSISFMSFMDSMMQRVFPLATFCPTSAKGSASGDGAR